MPMREEAPRTVSFIMGALCGPDELGGLERAVRSVLTQSYADLELLICDDGSSPEAKALLDALAAEDGRIRMVRGASGKSHAAKLNACLRLAEGRYIARMDDDDESLPGRLAAQLGFLEQHPETAFVGCNTVISREERDVGTWTFPEYPRVEDFYIRQPFVHPTLVFRAEALAAAGGYGEEKRCIKCEDYDLLLRLYEKGFYGANLQEFLFRYTIRADGKDGRSMGDRVCETRTRWVRFRALGRLPLALPFVVKPVLTGLIPQKALGLLKEKRLHA